jgi:hypothetical protein
MTKRSVQNTTLISPYLTLRSVALTYAGTDDY